MLTLAQINQELRRCLPRKPRIHDLTVARTLDGMLFRFKIARRQPAERNRPDVIQKRHDYANWFMGQAIVSAKFSSMNVVTCGELEARAERYEEKEHTGKSVDEEEEIDCRTRHFSNCWPCFSLYDNSRDECSKVCRLLGPNKT